MAVAENYYSAHIRAQIPDHALDAAVKDDYLAVLHMRKPFGGDYAVAHGEDLSRLFGERFGRPFLDRLLYERNDVVARAVHLLQAPLELVEPAAHAPIIDVVARFEAEAARIKPALHPFERRSRAVFPAQKLFKALELLFVGARLRIKIGDKFTHFFLAPLPVFLDMLVTFFLLPEWAEPLPCSAASRNLS